jgi:hypothetical protein
MMGKAAREVKNDKRWAAIMAKQNITIKLEKDLCALDHRLLDHGHRDEVVLGQAGYHLAKEKDTSAANARADDIGKYAFADDQAFAHAAIGIYPPCQRWCQRRRR